MLSLTKTYQKMNETASSCDIGLMIKVFVSAIVFFLLIQTYPLRISMRTESDWNMRLSISDKLSNWRNSNKSNGDNNCQLRQERTNIRRNLKRQLQANLMEFNYFLMNGQPKQQDGRIERKTHDQMIRLLAISGQLMAKEEEEEGVDKCLCNEANTRILAKLGDHMQSTMERLQNPSDCEKAQLLIFKWLPGSTGTDRAGLCSVMHTISFALTFAAASNRTLVFDEESMKWIGWHQIFEPITKCKYAEITSKLNATTIASFPQYEPNQSEHIVRAPSRWNWGEIHKHLHHHPVVPSEYYDLLHAHHSSPAAWFWGQFIQYLWKPRAEIMAQIKSAQEASNFTKGGPIVGIHVRRTDKSNEAGYQPLEEYMKWATLWFDVEERIAGKKLKRRLFVATDDPGIFADLHRKWGQTWEIISFHNNTTNEPPSIESRYTYMGMKNMIQDVHTLARCQYVVCTFSSNVCRMIYEMMQSLHVNDASKRVKSLDTYYDEWFYDHHMEVSEDYLLNTESGEIKAKRGDFIAISKVNWDGSIEGRNLRTQESGRFPSYLLKENFKNASFPIFQGLQLE